ncbi:MAG TPA: IS66 family transposase [Ktedonobacteraceae bacterium]|nr:IS66 family transposase [Ktedonobacteraceae bacterium]
MDRQIITSEVVVAYTQCPRKAFLLLCTDEEGVPHEYVRTLEQQKSCNLDRYLQTLNQSSHTGDSQLITDLKDKGDLIIQARLRAGHLEAYCDVLTRVGSSAKKESLIYEPTIVIGMSSLNKEHRLEILYAGYVLEKIQGSLPASGKIIGADGISHQLKLGEAAEVLLPLLRPLQAWSTSSSPKSPLLLLNKHCPSCQFRDLCRSKAEKEDNLSLISSIKPKDVQHYEKKGIFTVKQLSHIYKPRRPRKRAKNPQGVHKPELQALAIRTGKIYLQQIPKFSRPPVELFFDIEGLPDRECYYLIGLLICQDNNCTYQALWADTEQDEAHMWNNFLTTLSQYLNAPLYHYGRYDAKAIATLARRHGKVDIALQERLINVNALISGKVYFPVYSNGLKEIGHFLGARWTAAHASGLQSMVGRYRWDESQDKQYQDMLLTYNKEDCLALKLLVDELSRIKDSAQTLSQVDFVDQPKQVATPIGEEVHSQFETVFEFAHASYDKKKIHFHPEEEQKPVEGKKKRGSKKGYQGQRKVRPRATKVAHVPMCKECPHHGEPLQSADQVSKRVSIDLVITKNGIRKTITEYRGIRGYCATCKKTYAPPEIKKFGPNPIYGYRFQAWLVYLRVALRMTYEGIAELVAEQFHETIPLNYTLIAMKNLSSSYAETEEAIIQRLLASPFLHADETPIPIKATTQYVWTFTTDKYVIFRLSRTREANIAHEFLKDYTGILVSDFYSGYDAIACKQQKCWVHLIRDLNDDLWKYPFDSEYETFVTAVRNLIIPIMEAVKKYGLKKRRLEKFMRDVDTFYIKTITEKQYTSELAIKYQKRFIRYRDSLFTFLQYDGIPWHNNTAERALRHIGRQQVVSMSLGEAATHEYLRLLGIKQTCRFENKSFFRFLLSGEKDIDQFEKRKTSQTITAAQLNDSEHDLN